VKTRHVSRAANTAGGDPARAGGMRGSVPGEKTTRKSIRITYTESSYVGNPYAQ